MELVGRIKINIESGDREMLVKRADLFCDCSLSIEFLRIFFSPLGTSNFHFLKKKKVFGKQECMRDERQS